MLDFITGKEKIVYVSHPYGGLKENEEKVASLIQSLMKKFPNFLFISPIHAFSFAYHEVKTYEEGISYCLWLLDKCDEMWVLGNWEKSKGCKVEVEFCNKQNIPYYIIEDDE